MFLSLQLVLLSNVCACSYTTPVPFFWDSSFGSTHNSRWNYGKNAVCVG